MKTNDNPLTPFGHFVAAVGEKLDLPELGISELFGSKGHEWKHQAPVLRNITNNTSNRFISGTKPMSTQSSSPSGRTATAATTNLATGGIGAPARVLDQEQIDALLSLIENYDKVRANAKQKALLKKEADLKLKEEELEREKGKYEGKKLETLQDFAGTKTNTDINVRDTLENLISSLSTMQLGGGRALTRQILDAANRSNRQANATQAKNNQSLDAAFNEFSALNEADQLKIKDQYDYDVAEADRQWGQNKQNTLYKIADVYNAADMKDKRSRYMRDATALNKLIGDAVFLNPRYTGELRQMATPELADYTQNIARYDTSGVGGGVNPVGKAQSGVGVRALAVNDKDFGVKKKTEGELGYGV